MKQKTRLRFLMITTSALVLGIGSTVIYLFSTAIGLSTLTTLTIIISYFFLQWFLSPMIVKRSVKLQYMKIGEMPQFEKIVSDLSTKAGMPTPRLAIVDDPSPNAFVFGRTRGSTTLAINKGLTMLSGDEIKAVIAHEIGHIRNYDCIILTVVSSIPLMLYNLSMGLIGLAEGSMGKGFGSMLFSIILLAFGICTYVGYFLTHLLTLSLSRNREYQADFFSARLTRRPHDLESALAKISYGLCIKPSKELSLRCFCIGDPVSSRREIYGILKHKKEYDLDHDGKLDENELRVAMVDMYDLNKDGKLGKNELGLAMKIKTFGIISKLNEMLSTHPSTHKRIQLLDRLGKRF